MENVNRIGSKFNSESEIIENYIYISNICDRTINENGKILFIIKPIK